MQTVFKNNVVTLMLVALPCLIFGHSSAHAAACAGTQTPGSTKSSAGPCASIEVDNQLRNKKCSDFYMWSGSGMASVCKDSPRGWSRKCTADTSNQCYVLGSKEDPAVIEAEAKAKAAAEAAAKAAAEAIAAGEACKEDALISLNVAGKCKYKAGSLSKNASGDWGMIFNCDKNRASGISEKSASVKKCTNGVPKCNVDRNVPIGNPFKIRCE